MRNAYEILVGKPSWKRPLGKPRCRWDDTIKVNYKETGCQAVGWIFWAQDRVQWRAIVNTVMNIAIHNKAGNFMTI
jgi:hypothetical protein